MKDANRRGESRLSLVAAAWQPRRVLLLALLLVPGALLRLYHFQEPPLDYHSFRQAQTLMMARNYLQVDANLLLPLVDWFSTQRPPAMLPVGNTELALVPWMTSHLYRVFGFSHFLGRVVSMLSALVATYFLFRLAEQRYGTGSAWLAGVLMNLSPMFFELGRVQMPDMFAAAMLLLGLYYFQVWQQLGMHRHYAVSALGILLMLLGKATFIVNGLGLLFLAKGSRSLQKTVAAPALLLFGFLVLVPLLLFVQYSSMLAAASGIAFGVPQMLEHQRLFTFPFWAANVWRVVFWGPGPLGAALTLAGAVYAWRRNDFFPLAWLAGALFTYVLVPGAVDSNPHYALVVVPPAALLGGMALWWLAARPKLRVVVPVLLLGVAGPALVQMKALATPTITSDYRAAQWLQKNTAPEDLVLLRHDNPAMLYLADRKGWIPWVEEGGEYVFFNFETINRTVDLGARYLAVTEPARRLDEQSRDPFRTLHHEFTDVLYNSYLSHHGEGFVIFQLNRRPDLSAPPGHVIDFTQPAERRFLRGISQITILDSGVMDARLASGEAAAIVLDAPTDMRNAELHLSAAVPGATITIDAGEGKSTTAAIPEGERQAVPIMLARPNGGRLNLRIKVEAKGQQEAASGIRLHALRLIP